MIKMMVMVMVMVMLMAMIKMMTNLVFPFETKQNYSETQVLAVLRALVRGALVAPRPCRLRAFPSKRTLLDAPIPPLNHGAEQSEARCKECRRAARLRLSNTYIR